VTDEQLVEFCLKGKRRAQEALYNQYAGRLYAICMRYASENAEADDMLQEGFIRIFQKLDKFETGNGRALFPWMSRIIINTALNYLRSKRNHRNLKEEQMFYELISETDCDEEEITEQISTGEILDMIRQMPDGYRMVFNLYAIDNQSHQAISEQLGISVNTSKTQLMKARKYLAVRIRARYSQCEPSSQIN
jgi:RNA polymerase sigma-70 factor, ECF subfamily